MPIPIIGGLAGTLIGGAIAGPVLGIWTSKFMAEAQPDIRRAGYKGNLRDPNLYPTLEMVFDAYLRGKITEPNLVWMGRKNGASLNESLYGKDEDRLLGVRVWDATVEGRRPRLSPAELIRLRLRGCIPDECQFQELWQWTGAKPEDWAPFTCQEYFSLTRQEYMAAMLRGVFKDQGGDKGKAYFDRALQRIGHVFEDDVSILNELLKQIPGASDLIHFLIRDVFDPALVKSEKLLQDMPDEFRKWMAKQGFDWKLGFKLAMPDPGGGGGYTDVDATWSHLYWGSHWVPMSPTQSAEAVHRLRPGRNPRGVVWTLTDHDRNLRIADYVPAHRPVLKELAYRVLGLRQIRQLHFLGAFNTPADPDGKKEVNELWQDLGYDKREAGWLTEGTMRETTQRRSRELIGVTRAKIEQAWELGIIDDGTAESLLQTLGWSAADAKAAVAAWDLERLTRLTKSMISAVRRQYLLGDYDDVSAAGQLNQIGITAGRINTYLQLWGLERRNKRLEYSPATLTRWLILGTIDEQEFHRRLSVMGWTTDEQTRIIASALFSMKRAAPPQLQTPRGKQGRQGVRPAKELSDAQLKEMLKANILTPAEVTKKLTDAGHDQEDVDLILKLWSL